MENVKYLGKNSFGDELYIERNAFLRSCRSWQDENSNYTLFSSPCGTFLLEEQKSVIGRTFWADYPETVIVIEKNYR